MVSASHKPRQRNNSSWTHQWRLVMKMFLVNISAIPRTPSHWRTRLAVLITLAAFVLAGVETTSAQEPWEPPHGPGCFERWISEVTRLLNQHDGSAGFNSRKPWSINQYGIFVARGIRSNYEPDNWALYGANRYHWMWGEYKSELEWPVWKNVDFNNADLPGLRYFVRACIKSVGGTIGSGSSTGSGSLPSGQSCPIIPVDGKADCHQTSQLFPAPR